MGALEDIAQFWNAQSCGEVYAQGDSLREQLRAQAATRYELEPYIKRFACFDYATGRDVLEIGVGMGADHLQFARAKPRYLAGIDLTERAVQFTEKRLRLEGLLSDVKVANAECLPFPDNHFDLVYSWGVLHHAVNPQKTLKEAYRVLRPGGQLRVMIYQKYSITGLILWLRFGMFRKSLPEVYSRHLESAGTHAYSIPEARAMLKDFSIFSITTELSVSDLVQGEAGQRYRGSILSLARKLWPRWLLRHFKRFGLFMLIDAGKPKNQGQDITAAN